MVGIPAGLIISAIMITVLVSLLVIQKCTKGKSQRSDTPPEEEPLFISEESDSIRNLSPSPSPVKEFSLNYKSAEEDPVYDYIPATSIRAIETNMNSNVAYGSRDHPEDDDDNDNNYD